MSPWPLNHLNPVTCGGERVSDPSISSSVANTEPVGARRRRRGARPNARRGLSSRAIRGPRARPRRDDTSKSRRRPARRTRGDVVRAARRRLAPPVGLAEVAARHHVELLPHAQKVVAFDLFLAQARRGALVPPVDAELAERLVFHTDLVGVVEHGHEEVRPGPRPRHDDDDRLRFCRGGEIGGDGEEASHRRRSHFLPQGFLHAIEWGDLA